MLKIERKKHGLSFSFLISFKIQQFNELFSSVPLPYKFVNIPGPSDPQYSPPFPLYFYVNRVITQLSTKSFQHCGFIKTNDNRKWNASWGRQYQQREYMLCQSWQKINHWAGAFLMGRKDHFNTRMQELKERIKEKMDFYPESYLLPQQEEELEKHWKDHRLWIVKPSASSRGKGIHLLSSDIEEDPPIEESGIVQFYLERPLLITGRKFDLRLYVLVPSISPLRIYIHDSGLARFCTHKYVYNDDDKKTANVNDLNMHLTNFSLNKNDINFKRGEAGHESIENSKWSLPFFLEYLQKEAKIDVQSLMNEIHRVLISTVIAGECAIKKHHRRLIRNRHTSYEMYGVDILLDENLHPYIMEVNISPAMSGMDSSLDYEIKWRLMHELLKVARIIECNALLDDPCPGIRLIESECNDSSDPVRMKNVVSGSLKAWENPCFRDYMIVRDFVEESVRKGGFSRIFPKKKNYKQFLPCFDSIEYDDMVFFEWIELSKEKRMEALKTNWKQYEQQMEIIRKKSELPDQA